MNEGFIYLTAGSVGTSSNGIIISIIYILSIVVFGYLFILVIRKLVALMKKIVKRYGERKKD